MAGTEMIDWLRRYDARSARFLFLIGAMKCGTTSLAGLLMKHSSIFIGRHKEPNFFADRGKKLTSEREYLESWDLNEIFAKRGKWLLDASTSYSKFPAFGDAAQNIAGFTNKAKFIYLMRDPLRRIESQLAHAYQNSEGFPARYAQKRTNLKFYRHMIAVSSYAQQLANYERQFGRDKILLLQFEDLIGDTEDTMSEVWGFLNLVPPTVSFLEHKNSRAQKTKVPNTKLLPSELEAEIREQLKPEMEQLSRHWGVNVAKWGF
jgi:hypothetical protein